MMKYILGRNQMLKKIVIVLLLVAFSLSGCMTQEERKKAAKEDSQYIVYLQDHETGLVLLSCRTYGGAVVYSVVPTDQIDSVSSKISGYVEPSFVKEYKQRVGK